MVNLMLLTKELFNTSVLRVPCKDLLKLLTQSFGYSIEGGRSQRSAVMFVPGSGVWFAEVFGGSGMFIVRNALSSSRRGSLRL